jgi:23S rRNA (guanosine2251-2'-O)-methyltransferase
MARHQGVVAYLGGYRYRDLAEILARAIRLGEPPFVLVLDALQDVHNLGALLRSAEAAAVHGVVLSDRHGAGVTAAVRKASSGAVAHLAVARIDLSVALDDLRAHGVRLVGLTADGDPTYDQADLSGPLALVVGGEERGLSPAVSRRCHVLVRLPMHGRVASLNAGVAGSIALYEALRQRRRPVVAPPGPRSEL